MQLLAPHGYAAVLAGTLLQAESVLLLAGFAAQQGHLSLPFVLLVGFVGGTGGGELCFWSGRRWGGALQRRFPSLQSRVAGAALLLHRWDAGLVFGTRFLYGLHIAGPVAIGALGLAWHRFALFNALGAAVWAVVIGGLGFLLGQGTQRLLGDLQAYGEQALWGAIAAGVVFLARRQVLRRWQARRARRASGS